MSKLTRTLALVATLAMAATAFTACGGGGDESSSEDAGASSSAAESSSDAGGDSSSEEGGDSSSEEGGDSSSEEGGDSSSEEGGDSSSEEGGSSAAVDPSTLTDDDPTLSVVCWTNTDINLMNKMFDNKITWVTSGTAGGEAATQYSSFLNSGKDVDLFFCDAGWALKYMTPDYAIPLSELGITVDDYADAYQYTVDVATVDGELMGASWQAAAGGWCYNTDLASELGYDSPDAMQAAISDWDGFKKVAGEVKDKWGGEVTMTATLAGMWQAFSTSTDTPFVEDGNKINTETAKEFVTMAKEYVDNGYVDPTVKQWETAWNTLGVDGKTLGYFFSTWCLVPGAQLEGCGGTAGNWNIVQGPQQYYWGGTWVCASKNINTKKTAYDWYKTFTIDGETMKQYAEGEAQDFVNNKKVMEEIVEAGTHKNDLLGGQDQFAVLVDVADGIKMNETLTKYDQDVKDSLNDAVFEGIESKDVDAIISDFVSKAQAKNADLTS